MLLLVENEGKRKGKVKNVAHYCLLPSDIIKFSIFMLRVLFFHSRKRLYTYHSLIAFYYFVAVMCESILNTLLQIQKWKYHYILAYIVTSKIIKRTNVELKEFS